MTLLEKAQAVPGDHKTKIVMDAELKQKAELAFYWVTGQITNNQAAVALGARSSSVGGILAWYLASGIKAGYLRVEKVQ